MHIDLKIILGAACLASLVHNPACAQSSFDILFKSEAQYADVVVEEILTTDTLALQGRMGEKREVIKLIGLQAPNAPRKRKTDIKRNELGMVIKEPVTPETPLEENVFEFVRNLLVGRHVRLEFDTEKKDEDFQTFAYVFLKDDGTFVNAEILRQGYAYLQIRPPNIKYADELRQAYKEARDEKRGLQGQ
jgi:micrococcal nuclease